MHAKMIHCILAKTLADGVRSVDDGLPEDAIAVQRVTGPL